MWREADNRNQRLVNGGGGFPAWGKGVMVQEFSAADIRVFLAKNLPYYDREDGEDFIYLVRAEDVERVAIQLYDYLIALKRRNSGN